MHGQAIESIIDWLQKPEQAHDDHLIILVVDKKADVLESVKFFKHIHPTTVNVSNVELRAPELESTE